MNVREKWIEFILELQNDICHALEKCDGKTKFAEDAWDRPEGGGGKTRVIANGNVFEKGGVNTSVVYGDVTEAIKNQLKIDGAKWFACGLSLVIHPCNPFVPTVHANYRMFELYDAKNEVIDRWFGGGTDLTPYYLFDDDAKHFHQTYKDACDTFDSSFYYKFKADCDNYFVNWHRNKERRGIGGIFYDYKRPEENKDVTFWMNLARSCGYAFIDSYIPIVEKRKSAPFGSEQKHWQEIRRGRYTEFNLVHDRGTLFGLKTNGRIESILMSLPPTVRFEYNYYPKEGSEEDKLLQACLHPRDWLLPISEHKEKENIFNN
ncbi:MAG TPA: oxygen-dependent coproporphyrinogen oxidase [Segetibacter sp.]|nr:oxygen-dependent coproporphyrinogen oxidase [Segetibacter sp.]